MLPDFELEQSVSHETLAWSKEVLEIPNEYFNGLPACPYAKKAWADNRVGITFKYTGHWQDLYTLISTWDDSKDVIILVDFCPLPLDKMDDYLDQLNEAISKGFFINRDMFLMGFHPDDVGNELLDDSDFESTVDVPYAMIFLQRLTKLQEASDTLRLKGYYDVSQKYYDADHLYERRLELYRRLSDES